jgi:hypothetical protein
MSHTPSYTTPRALSDGEGTGNAGAKRKRSGTVRGRSTPLTLASLDATLSRGEEGGLDDPSQSVMSVFGTFDLSRMALDRGVYGTLANALGEALQGQVPMGNVILARYIIAEPQDKWTLTRQVERSLTDGLDPSTFETHTGVTPIRLWCRPLPQNSTDARKKVPPNRTLHNDFSIAHRCVENRSFVIYGQLALFWPPPIVVGSEDRYDVLWSFNVTIPTEELTVIREMGHILGRKYNGMFCKRVRRNNPGLGYSVLTRDAVQQGRCTGRRFLAPPPCRQRWNAGQ